MSPRRLRIVCATDLQPRSDAAVERAGLLADRLAAELTLLYVVIPSESEQALEETLQQGQSNLRSRTRAPLWRARAQPGTAIRAGNPARLVVAEVANRPGADLLVLGPHRRRPLRDALEGTIAEKVMVSRSCPVLMVQARPEAQYRRVLLALDLSAASAGAIRAAEQLVLSDEATATIVHAQDPPYQGMLNYANVNIEHIADYVQGWRTEAARGIRNLVRRESADAGRFIIHVEAGHTVRGILRTVEQFGPDLPVMGTRGGGRLHRAVLGSVANSVIRQVACDVMVVPAGTQPVPDTRAAAYGEAWRGVRPGRSGRGASL